MRLAEFAGRLEGEKRKVHMTGQSVWASEDVSAGRQYFGRDGQVELVSDLVSADSLDCWFVALRTRSGGSHESKG